MNNTDPKELTGDERQVIVDLVLSQDFRMEKVLSAVSQIANKRYKDGYEDAKAKECEHKHINGEGVVSFCEDCGDTL